MKTLQWQRESQSGYSFIEVLLASTIFVGLSAVTYSFLNTQRSQQTNAIRYQAQNRASISAIERFRSDVMLVDPNWVSVGIPAVFPHQGLGLGSNYYQDTIMQSEESLPDGVTFLRRDIQADRFLEVAPSANDYCVGLTSNKPAGTTGVPLYDSYITYIPAGFSVAVGDWILVFEDGRSAIGVVSQVDASLPKFKLREPSSAEKQNAQVLGTNITGLITQPGVLYTTTDVDSTFTPSDLDDDYECFTTAAMKLQKMGNPVSYYISYATNDGQDKSATNLYQLDGNGHKRKMLVRAELNGTTVNREYLTEISNLEITYDHYANNDAGTDVDLGRGLYKGYLLNTSNDFLVGGSYDASNDPFHYTAGIISINMTIQNESRDSKDPTKTIVKNHHIKASFDSVSGQNEVIVAVDYESYVTQSLSFSSSPSNDYDERVGRPFLYATGANQEMIVPVWRHMTNGVVFSDETGQQVTMTEKLSFLIVRDAQSIRIPWVVVMCLRDLRLLFPVDNATGQTVQTGEVAADMTKFFQPVLIPLTANGYRIVLVGGVALKGTTDEITQAVTIERTPGFATITVPENVSMETFLSKVHLQQKKPAMDVVSQVANGLISQMKTVGRIREI
ncbi:MAG: hypothetical protein R3A45_06015 [Bdellovibrionota bacterium]